MGEIMGLWITAGLLGFYMVAIAAKQDEPMEVLFQDNKAIRFILFAFLLLGPISIIIGLGNLFGAWLEEK